MKICGKGNTKQLELLDFPQRDIEKYVDKEIKNLKDAKREIVKIYKYLDTLVKITKQPMKKAGKL